MIPYYHMWSLISYKDRLPVHIWENWASDMFCDWPKVKQLIYNNTSLFEISLIMTSSLKLISLCLPATQLVFDELKGFIYTLLSFFYFNVLMFKCLLSVTISVSVLFCLLTPWFFFELHTANYALLVPCKALATITMCLNIHLKYIASLCISSHIYILISKILS